MKLSVLLEGIEVIGGKFDPSMEIGNIFYDSRIKTKGAFICIKGTLSDGHDYAAMAKENGAEILICEKNTGVDLPFVLVNDTRKAMALMCKNYFSNPLKDIKVIGVTGTNGKSSTTLFIKHILEDNGYKVGLINTINNMIGDKVIETKYTTPEPFELFSLFNEMRNEKVDFVVMEVSSHSLAQDRVYGIDFEVGVFTNLTQDHLDFHKTIDNYAFEKSKLFKKSKFSVINVDDDFSDIMMNSAKGKVITYSDKSDNSSITAKEIKLRGNGIEYDVVTLGNIGRVNMNIPGEFSVYNSMAAIGACMCLDIPFADIISSIKTSSSVKGRIEVVPINKDFYVIIDYAHTPDALENILKTIKGFSKERIITLVGCGGNRDKTKRPIMGKIASSLSDFVIATSDNPRNENPMDIINDMVKGFDGMKTPFEVIENRKDAIKRAFEIARKDDIILLAGKGHETYQILKDKPIHFDEREIVKEMDEKF